MIVRPYYLDMLKTYRDVPLVKILAGIRRCGKSTIQCSEIFRHNFCSIQTIFWHKRQLYAIV